MNTPKVSIVILNWNGWADTVECLESLYRITYKNYEVIVVDNASSNNSIDKIKEWASGKSEVASDFLTYNPQNKPIRCVELSEEELRGDPDVVKKKKNLGGIENKKLFLVKNAKNYGFAKGNNIATKSILDENESEYVLLLNNDTVVAPDFLNELVGVAESDREAAIVGPKMYFYNYNNKKNVIWYGGGKINWKKYPIYQHIDEYKEGDGILDSTCKETAWVSGACMLIKKSKISPLLDESYFFGCEDVDKCLKTRKAGHKIFYVPSAVVWHKVGASRRKTFKKRIEKNMVDLKLIFKNFF